MFTEIDPKKIFEVLVDGLKDAYKELLDLGLKISGAILIVLGWFASQKNPLSFLCGEPFLVCIALLLVVLGFGLVCFLFSLVYTRARDSFAELISRGYDPALYLRFRITKPMLAGGIAGQALLLGGVFVYILFRYYLRAATTCA